MLRVGRDRMRAASRCGDALMRRTGLRAKTRKFADAARCARHERSMNSHDAEARNAARILAQRFSAGCWKEKSHWGAACWEIACCDRAGLALRSRP